MNILKYIESQLFQFIHYILTDLLNISSDSKFYAISFYIIKVLSAISILFLFLFIAWYIAWNLILSNIRFFKKYWYK